MQLTTEVHSNTHLTDEQNLIIRGSGVVTVWLPEEIGMPCWMWVVPWLPDQEDIMVVPDIFLFH